MKKFMLFLAAALLMLTVACAEAPAAVPAQVVPYEEGMLQMTDAIDKVKEVQEVLPDNCETHAELVKMTDGSYQWIVSIFDMTSFTDAWCVSVDAKSGEVLSKETTNMGFFTGAHDSWIAAKGPEELWSMEDKLLFDTLYSMVPTYGMPVEGDMAQGEALVKAMNALAITDVSDYEIGYGYIAGSAEETNGMWEVYFIKNGEFAHKVNLDAVTGEIYLIEPDEEGNG